MARFFYKNNETSSLSFKKRMLFKESHYGAKAPQNMMYKEQNKIKNSLLFQFYHPNLLKNAPILQFLSNFSDFWLYFDFEAKMKVYNINL